MGIVYIILEYMLKLKCY